MNLSFPSPKALLPFLCCLSTFAATAQNDTTNHKTSYFAEAGGMAATNSRTPFWLRANQFGTVPLENPFAFVRLGGQTTLGTDPRKPQLHLQAELVANAGKTSNVLLPAAAATLRFRKFELYAGRRKEFFGLGDTLLTSGSYAWSGNALPLPKVQIGTRGFVPIGFTKGLFAIHATYAHGWFGRQDSVQGSYLHQKTVYVRLGKPQWKARFYLGIIHNVQWGGKSEFVRQDLTLNGRFPSSFKDYTYLIVANTPSGEYSAIDTLNQLGNHLGSIDLGFELNGKNWDVFAYHQHPFEDKSGLVFVNFPDGLWGLRFKNKNQKTVSTFRVNQLTFEYLTTVDKGANLRPDLQQRYEADQYFYHSQYIDGWAYNHRIIGTPFITRYLDTRPENIDNRFLQNKLDHKMINNNTVKVLYTSFSGTFKNGVTLRSRLSYSQNKVEFFYNSFRDVDQFSGIISASFPISHHTEIQTAFSLDQGRLYNNNFGGMLSIRKSW